MAKCAAFLRGINVGGHKPVRMDQLKEAFEALGFRNVRTLLASGNVLFEARRTNPTALEKKIERKLEKTFGHEIGTLVRTIDEVQILAAAEPFRKIKVTPNVRLFVTLVPTPPKPSFAIPYRSPDGSYEIIRLGRREVFSVLTVGRQWAKNLRQMDILEKEFGKRITTRSWNTIVRVAKAGI